MSTWRRPTGRAEPATAVPATPAAPAAAGGGEELAEARARQLELESELARVQLQLSGMLREAHGRTSPGDRVRGAISALKQRVR